MLTADFLEHPVSRVIWDWNGTLFNDAWLCMDVMNGLLREHDLPLLTLDRYQRVFDFPVIEYYRRLGFDFERTTFEEVGTAFIREYERRRLECDLHDGGRHALHCLRQAGIPQTVLSAYKLGTLESLLNHFEIRSFFEQVIGSDDHYAGGKLEKALQWVKEQAEAPEHMLLIGDTTHDAEVAAAMGAQCVLLEGGNQHAERLRVCNAPLFRSLRNLVDRWLVPEWEE